MAIQSDKARSDAKTIMLVDDEPDILTVTARMLEANGFNVHGYDDSENALAHVEMSDCKDCTVLISDIKMPKINGIQLAKKVKLLRPNIKIILMTAFEVHKQEWQRTLPNTRIDEFIEKPIRMNDLVEAVQKCANANQAQLQIESPDLNKLV